jgi:hypothetical protein
VDTPKCDGTGKACCNIVVVHDWCCPGAVALLLNWLCIRHEFVIEQHQARGHAFQFMTIAAASYAQTGRVSYTLDTSLRN